MIFKTKRPYLLLELLIAFTIVSGCILPLVSNPLRFFRSEIRSLQRMELERLAEVSFASIKTSLYKNEIPWQDLVDDKYEESPYIKDRVCIPLGTKIKRDYERIITFKVKKHEEGRDLEDCLLLNTRVKFIPLSNTKAELKFSQKFFAIKAPASLQNNKTQDKKKSEEAKEIFQIQ